MLVPRMVQKVGQRVGEQFCEKKWFRAAPVVVLELRALHPAKTFWSLMYEDSTIGGQTRFR